MQEFVLTVDHIKLFRKMWVDWEEGPAGAPVIDLKRPYGTKNVVHSIAKILDWEFIEDQYGEEILTRQQADEAERLHREMRQALQVVLSATSFEPGRYIKNMAWNGRWEKAND
jgi:hypothetical protein